MREKYESLSLSVLRDLAKARGIKGISALRKPELIERMLVEDQLESKMADKTVTEQKVEPEVTEKEAARPEPQRQENSRSTYSRSERQESGRGEYSRPQQNRYESRNDQVRDNRHQQRNNYQRNDNQRSYQRGDYNRDNNRGDYNRDNNSRGDYNRQDNNRGGYNRQDNNRSDYNRQEAPRYESPRQTYPRYETAETSQNTNNGNMTNSSYTANYGNSSESSNTGNNTFTTDSMNPSFAGAQSSARVQSSAGAQSSVGAQSPIGAATTVSSATPQPSQDFTPQFTYSRQDMTPEDPDAPRLEGEKADLDSGERANGILEVMPDGFGFIRCENYMPGENDIYVSPAQIRRFNMKTGDIVQGNIRIKTQGEKFSALLYVSSINGFHPSEGQRRYNFEDMTPIFPNKRLILERPGGTTAMRIVDLISPIGKGQRGMIVSPPKAGKTTLLKDVAKSILRNSPDCHLIILLIDERPEEVTDIKEAIYGKNVEVIYSTFDELPDHHKRVSEMVMERAKRLVEHKKDVVILLDSITRLARAYNLIIPPSGRTLSGGLDPAALHMPKRFFGAARNMREGGSLTVLATALVDTGSKMDDVIYEEFKGTGNMELVLDRKLQEKRVFPAIDIQKSGTRREDLLLTLDEQEAVYHMRRALNGMKADEAVEQILNMFSRTKNNEEFVQTAKKQKFL